MSAQIDAPTTRSRLDAAWHAAPEHLRPVIAAVRDCGVGMLFISQDTGPFGIPRHDRRPAVTIIGDDFDQSRGPDGFHAPSVRRAIRECSCFAVIAGEATAEIYATITAGAVAGGRVMIVETRPDHEILWVELIQKLAPGRMIIWATVRGGRA